MMPLSDELLSTLQSLSPERLAAVDRFARRLGEPEGDAVDPVHAQELMAEADEQLLAGTGSTDEPWIDWIRRPFDAICHDDLSPITRLYRDAVERRAINRVRYGAV